MPLLFLAVFSILSITGCDTRTAQYSDSGSDAPSIGQSVPEDVRTESQHLVEQFVADVQSNDYAAIKKKMTSAAQAKAPKTFDAWLAKERYESLAGAKNWKFDLTQYSAGGKKLVVHTGFTGADNSSYRTNFILQQDGKSWMIESLLPPTRQRAPVEQQVSGTAPVPGK